MTIRPLPELRAQSAMSHAEFLLADKAVQAWDRSVMAAAAEDNVISILDVIGTDPWTGEGVSSRRISAALRTIGDKPVTVQVNSPGGSFFEGLAIYNMLRLHPKAVTVQVLGMAASAASFIAMAGDRIEVAKAGMMMIHNTQWIAAGDRHAMKETFDAMSVFDNTLATLYVDRTGNTSADVHQWMDAETFMSGEDAIERGFADALLPSDAAAHATAQVDEPFAYRLEAILTKHGVPRAERRKTIREFTEGMPGAALRPAKPGAGEPVAEDGSAHLSLALARLKLTQI